MGGYTSIMAGKDKTRFSEEEVRKFSNQSTKVYLNSVMQKLFKEKWSQHLDNLLKGDRATLDLCAMALSKDLSFFPLLHVLCLVTGTRFDLNEKDHVKAADAWCVWYGENKANLAWDDTEGKWGVKK